MTKLKIAILSIISILFFGFNMNAQITKSEKESLRYMYEEEKLAHDMYSVLSEKYNLPIFKNISKSETYHMSLVENLCLKYDVNIKKNERGIFENLKLQKVFNQFKIQGEQNLIQALIIGATIEDLDIFDLTEYLNTDTNKEIKDVYQKLLCGSKNHMRAFIRQLKFKETTYTPKYIKNETLLKILNEQHQKCF